MLKIVFLLLFSVSLNAQFVYKTPSGECYHLTTCRMVKNVSERISINNAHELGLRACKICKPPNLATSANAVSPNKAKGQNETNQCLGFTKAGPRCKHMTKIGNGYCFQHQP